MMKPVILGKQWLESQRQWDELQTLALAYQLPGTSADQPIHLYYLPAPKS